MAALATVGCTSSTELAELQTQVEDVQLQMLELQKNGVTRDDLAAARNGLSEEIARVAEVDAALTAEVRRVSQQVEALETKLDEALFRLAQLAQQLSATGDELRTLRDAAEAARTRRSGSPSASDRGSGSDATRDPRAVYEEAYADYTAGNLDLAILGFRQYLEAYDDDGTGADLADNATYWLGESYYRQNRFVEAIEQFDQVLTRFPRSERGASALLKKGYAYLEQGQRAQGVVQLRRVVCDYQGTDEAELGAARLGELGEEAGC